MPDQPTEQFRSWGLLELMGRQRIAGELGVLKNHDLDIELTAPELISAKQGSIEAGEKVAPINGKRGKGLGTDAEQAERQAEELAKDPTQKWDWPFPGGGPKTPEEALAGSVGVK